MTILWDITCSPHRCNGYRKFLTLSQVHHFRGVERWTRRRGGNTCSLQRGWEGEQGGEGNKEQGWEVNKDERGTRNKDESWTRRRGEQGTRMRGEQGGEGGTSASLQRGWEGNKEGTIKAVPGSKVEPPTQLLLEVRRGTWLKLYLAPTARCCSIFHCWFFRECGRWTKGSC